MNSSPSSLPRASRLTLWLLVPAVIGLFDATYLTSAHYAGFAVTCSILGGCEKVTTSQYATISGVPVALLGALYYLAVLLLVLGYWETKKVILARSIAVLTGLGFLFSLWFLYLQVYVIKALCLYCLTSAAASTILFSLSLIVLHQQKKTAYRSITE